MPVGSTKKPVPKISLCSSTARILTTALEARSKTSLTSRLIELADCSCPRARSTSAIKLKAKAILNTAADWDRKENPGPSLEPESCLITHGNAIQHIARRRGSPLSVGALIRFAQGTSAQNARRDGRSQVPFRVGTNRRSEGGLGTGGKTSRVRRLINFERDDGRANQQRGYGRRIRSQRRNIEAEHEIMRALQADSPERLTQQFIALAAVKLMQKILEISRRRLLVPFQPKQ